MPASSLTELYNFEGNVESAFEDWLGDQTLEIVKSQDFDTLEDDYIAASFELGETTQHAYEISAGVWEYDQYACSVSITIRTRRHGETDSQTASVRSRHQELCARVRTWMSVSKAKGSALETYLAYYEFQFLRPAATQYASEGDFDETTLVYDGQISILPSAWP